MGIGTPGGGALSASVAPGPTARRIAIWPRSSARDPSHPPIASADSSMRSKRSARGCQRAHEPTRVAAAEATAGSRAPSRSRATASTCMDIDVGGNGS
eukprot:scaffold4229_cov30-Tisochrysis_lutea.AAC.15